MRPSARRSAPSGRGVRVGLPAAILLVALALRLHRLGGANLWWDEALAVWGVRQGLAGVTLWTAADVHPPLYFWSLWAWVQLAGESEFALRALSALVGVLTVAVVYRLGARVAGWRVGALAALLTATARFHVWWSQEARMYALAGLLGMLSLDLFLRWLDAERAPDGRPGRPLWLYALATAGALYTIFLMGALLVVQNLVVAAALVRRRPGRRAMVGRWALAQAGIALALAAWLALSWGRMRTWSVAEPFDPWLFARLYATLLTTGISVDIGRYTAAVALPFLLLGLGAAAYALRRPRSTPAGAAGLTLGLTTLVPAAAVYLATLPRGLFYTPHVEARYLLPFAPAFWLLLAWGVVRLGARWRVAGRVALVALLALWLTLLPGHYRGRARRDDLLTMARAIASQAAPGDAVLLSSGGRYPLFLYPYGALAPAATLPPVIGIPPGEGHLARDDVDDIMAPLAARYDRLWLAEVEAHLTDPEGLARAWLDAHRSEVFALSFGHNALRLYDAAGQAPRPARDAYAPQYPVNASVGDGLLWGWELPLAEYAPGDVARVALLWERAPAGPVDVTLRNARGQVLMTRTLAPSPNGGALRQQADLPILAATPAGRYDVALSVGGAERVLGAMRIVGARRLPGGAPDVAIGARFGPEITLLGYTVHGGRGGEVSAAPGETVILDLYWSVAEKQGLDYTVFTHLLGEAHNPKTQGPVWGQHDAQPADGGYPTSQWLVGDTIVDRHRLAIDGDAPPGGYRIEVGLYTVEDGRRLVVTGPGGTVLGDRVLLDAAITITERKR